MNKTGQVITNQDLRASAQDGIPNHGVYSNRSIQQHAASPQLGSIEESADDGEESDEIQSVTDEQPEEDNTRLGTRSLEHVSSPQSACSPVDTEMEDAFGPCWNGHDLDLDIDLSTAPETGTIDDKSEHADATHNGSSGNVALRLTVLLQARPERGAQPTHTPVVLKSHEEPEQCHSPTESWILADASSEDEEANAIQQQSIFSSSQDGTPTSITSGSTPAPASLPEEPHDTAAAKPVQHTGETEDTNKETQVNDARRKHNKLVRKRFNDMVSMMASMQLRNQHLSACYYKIKSELKVYKRGYRELLRSKKRRRQGQKILLKAACARRRKWVVIRRP